MSLERALIIFGYSKSLDIKRSELKKKFRLLIKKNHPDSTKNPEYGIQEIKDALEALIKYCDFVENYRSKEFRPRFIDIECLVNLYRHKQAIYNGEKFERADLKRGNIFLDINYTLNIDGLNDNKAEYIFYNVQDKYNINIDIPVTKNSIHHIKFVLYDKEKKIKLENKDVSFKIVFDYNIEFIISLHRKVLDEENNNVKE